MSFTQTNRTTVPADRGSPVVTRTDVLTLVRDAYAEARKVTQRSDRFPDVFADQLRSSCADLGIRPRILAMRLAIRYLQGEPIERNLSTYLAAEDHWHAQLSYSVSRRP